MRLSEADRNAFSDVLVALVPQGRLYLYGSRTDDSLKGGDIDLLLVVADLDAKRELSGRKSVILVAFKKRVGERKIDFSIATESELLSDPFFASVIGGALILAEWKSGTRA